MSQSASAAVVAGRLVLEDRVVAGRLEIRDGRIAAVLPDDDPGAASGPLISPGFVDVHVHGWGGHDAMGDAAALDGMARALVRRGVTSFLPTAVTASMEDLQRFAEGVRSWLPNAPDDGATPLGFNLEGPFLARGRCGAHDPALLRAPASIAREQVARLIPDLRLVTIAPELDGATDLIRWLRREGVTSSLGHSDATVEEARLGYDAGATSTTHLFNAMSGIDHRAPGLALAALLEDTASVELIADGLHVAPAVWPLITRLKPADRWLLVSDAVAAAGTGATRTRIGGLDCEIVGGRVTLAGTQTLAGSVIALDDAVRNVVASGVPLPAAVAAASRNAAAVIGVTDRGRIAEGQRADLLELDDELGVRRVMRGGRWVA